MEDGDAPLGMDAVTPYRDDLQGVCWWCGSTADSLEHRHKRTDLLRLWDGDEGPVWGGGNGETEAIRGPNSKSSAIRFGRVLCQRCNNERSQPFDLAYDVLSDALVAHMDGWWFSPGISLETIYGDQWPPHAMNLARYYVKNFGCLMADQGIPPQQTMRDFLNGREAMDNVGLFLVKSESHYIGHRDYFRKLGENASLFRPPDAVWISPSEGRITGYIGTTLVGYVGVLFQWLEDSGRCDSFFYHPNPVLNQLSADPGLADELAEIDRLQQADRYK